MVCVDNSVGLAAAVPRAQKPLRVPGSLDCLLADNKGSGGHEGQVGILCCPHLFTSSALRLTLQEALDPAEDGEIIIVQRVLRPEEAQGLRHPTADLFLDYVCNRWAGDGWGWECLKLFEGGVRRGIWSISPAILPPHLPHFPLKPPTHLSPRRTVSLKRLKDPKETGVQLEMMKGWTYSQVWKFCGNGTPQTSGTYCLCGRRRPQLA